MSQDHDLPYDHAFERGMRNRRAALGDAWVDQSVAKANSFNAEFQHFITDYAWHGVWGRPGLDWKTRRCMVLAITSALGRWDEFEIHLRGSLTPGNAHTLTPEEVREALFQVAIYAGVPAANTGFAKALGILRELGMAPLPHPATDAWHPGVGRSAFTTSRPKLHATVRDARDAQGGRQGAQPHTVVLSHALGQDHSMWDTVANTLAGSCKVICPDTRGHGRSEIPASPLSLAELAADAARLIDELAGEPVVWIGLSMGGMIGQELAIRHPEKIKALVLANTTSQYTIEAKELISQRIHTVDDHGLSAIANGTMSRFFTESFRTQNAATMSRHQRLLESIDPEGYTACAAAVCDVDTLSRLHQIRVPTLVIAGQHDESTPLPMSQALRQGITGARLEVLPHCAHLSACEQPAAFAELVGDFIASL